MFNTQVNPGFHSLTLYIYIKQNQENVNIHLTFVFVIMIEIRNALQFHFLLFTYRAVLGKNKQL